MAEENKYKKVPLFVPNAQYGLRTKAEIIKFLDNEEVITCLCPICKGFDKPPLALTYCQRCLGTGFLIYDKIKNEYYNLVRNDFKDRFLKAESDYDINKALGEEHFKKWANNKREELKKSLDL